MAFSFDQIFAADPANPQNVATNAAITIFAPGDPTQTPLVITDPSGGPLTNPVMVNANGFGSAFQHATLDRVAWAGGGFSGFFTSYEGIKNEAVAARTAAEAAAATAGAEAAAVAEEAIGTAADAAAASEAYALSAASEAAASATAAANSAALVGAPADTAIAAALNNGASASRGALEDTIEERVKKTPAAQKQRVTAQGAITISWDDGYERIHRVLFPILRDEFPDQRHTFGITSNLLNFQPATYMTDAQVLDIHAAGHEIANHSYSHKNMATITAGERLQEFDQSNTYLETLIGEKVDTFIYPLGNNARNAQTDNELYGRFKRIVNAGVSWGGSMVPMNQRYGLFQIPRPPVWDSSTHQTVLELIRQAATQPVILNLYAHRPGDGPTGGTSGGGVADMTVAELREGLALIESLGIPVVTIRDAYPGQPVLGNPGAEQGTASWTTVVSGTGKSFTSVTDTPAAGLNGTKSFKLSSTDVGGFIYAYQDIPCVEGQTYVFSGRLRRANTTTAGTYTIRMQGYDQYGASVGGLFTAAVGGLVDGTWSPKVFTAPVLAPVGAQFMRVSMIISAHVGDLYADHLYYGRSGLGDFG